MLVVIACTPNRLDLFRVDSPNFQIDFYFISFDFSNGKPSGTYLRFDKLVFVCSWLDGMHNNVSTFSFATLDNVQPHTEREREKNDVSYYYFSFFINKV